MEIVNVRIDGRLVHAQVVNLWIATLNVHHIVVIDDGVDQDEIQQIALKMVCPKNIKLSIVSIRNAKSKLEELEDTQERVLVVMKGVNTLSKVIDSGYFFNEVNIASLNNKEEGMQITKTVKLSPDQIIRIKELYKKGVKITSQLVPSNEKINLIELL